MTTKVAESRQPSAGSPSEAPEGRRRIEEFEIREGLGQGGMATVSRARDLRTGKDVALKVVHAHLATDEQLVRRFRHEVTAQAGLSHRNLVELVGWGEDDQGRPFMALEYVDGLTLQQLVREGELAADLALMVARDVARALEAAHARGLVHRDVKPANVLVTREGVVKLADFGIAKTAEMTRLTSTGNVIGTPAYMSPEQAMAKAVDGRSDLFSLGVMLHELLVGRNPFLADNPATTLSRVVSHRPRPLFESRPETPPSVEGLLERLLAKEPDERPGSAGEVARELQRCIECEGFSADEATLAAHARDPEGTTRRLAKRSARRHFARAVAAYRAASASASAEKGTVEGAIWELFIATRLDPADEEARTWLEQVASERGYHVRDRAHPRTSELEAKLADDPDHLPTLLQLAKAHRAQGNFLRMVHYYRRAKALRPPDRYTQSQLDTLLAGQAATAVAGVSAAPQPARSAIVTAPEPAVADGWGDFLGGVARSGWGRAAAVLVGLFVAVLLFGSLFDGAVQASRSTAPGTSVPPPEVVSEPSWELLDTGRRQAGADRHEEAVRTLRRLADRFPDSPYRAEGLFLLGDSLERLGNRSEALSVHRDNVLEAGLGDDWAARSQARRGELLRLAGDADAARLAYDQLADETSGDMRHDALVALAEIAVERGEPRIALAEHETVLLESDDAMRRARARLAMAEILEELGDPAAAAEHYRTVESTSDHRSEEFARATEGLARVDG